MSVTFSTGAKIAQQSEAADVSVEAVPGDSQDLPKGFLENAPFVAIEIISPSNTRRDTERKTKQYLAANGQEVWLVYPDAEETHVFRASQPDPEIYARGNRSAAV